MAKIQTLGLSDEWKKRPSEPASPTPAPSAPSPEEHTSSESAALLESSPTPDQSIEAMTVVDAAESREENPPTIGDSFLDADRVGETVIHPEAELLPAPPPDLQAGVPTLPKRPSSRHAFGQFVFLILVLLAAGFGALGGMVFVHSSDLPQIRQLMDYRPDVITELYADDGTPIGSFALEHRVIVTYDQIPKVLKDAVLAVEDRHFESHWGVDVIRVVGAAVRDLIEWRRAQGASTLTMQLTRVLFLTPERSFRRKFQEVLMAIQIERHFTKPQIFTMYANQVALGHGNFGFAAAAQFYFGKQLDQLTLPEAALLAGLPRTPTGYSPLLYPDRARQRRNQVLAMMRETGKISEPEYRAARATPLALNIQRWSKDIAPYFIEDARLFLEKKHGAEAVHEKGLRVYTTLNLGQQVIAEEALRNGLHAYDKRYGWRGPVANIIQNPPTLANGLLATLATYTHPDWREPLQPDRRVHGLVMEVKSDHAVVRMGEWTVRVTAADCAWTGKKLAEVFAPGDVDLFLIQDISGETVRATLDQRPQVQGALVAIENSTGAVKAMVGGYDFEESKFNRARQASRQAGSSFKPYVYAVVLMDGARPFDTIVDEPISYASSSGPWSPRNYDGKFEGTVTLLHALAESRNIPAVKLLDRVGVDKVIKLCRKFGLTSRLVPNLPLALGASDLTLLEHTSAFTTFPNDGVHIAPRTITRVTNYDGRVIDDFPPEVTDVIPAPIARLEVSMLREVFFAGTATRARALAQKYPMAGKTGTTNDFADAAFVGFTPSITVGVWVGFDDRRTLGPKEEGARVALPIWMEFMEEYLKDRPVEDFPYSPRLTQPEQVEQILASAGTERLLAQGVGGTAGTNAPSAQGTEAATSASPLTRQPPPAASAKPPAEPASTGPASPPNQSRAATPTASVPPR
jgi:penicillin-binding protein 1A